MLVRQLVDLKLTVVMTLRVYALYECNNRLLCFLTAGMTVGGCVSIVRMFIILHFEFMNAYPGFYPL